MENFMEILYIIYSGTNTAKCSNGKCVACEQKS